MSLYVRLWRCLRFTHTEMRSSCIPKAATHLLSSTAFSAKIAQHYGLPEVLITYLPDIPRFRAKQAFETMVAEVFQVYLGILTTCIIEGSLSRSDWMDFMERLISPQSRPS